MRLTTDSALTLGVEILEAAGATAAVAETQIDLLVEAELRGHPSHGLLRLPRLVERIHNGVLDPSARGISSWVGDSLLKVDGQQGFGPIVALDALQAVSTRARTSGVAVAAIRNNNHLGMLAWYVERIARAGQLAIAFTTSEALVHPAGGRHALVGSNPVAIGVPAEPDPLVFDMATSAVSMGKIIDHANRSVPLDPDWAVDADGEPTTDPQRARAGAISPFGGAKGYGLGIALEALVGALTGSAYGTDVLGTLDSVNPATKGDVFVVLDVDDPDAASATGAYLETVRRSARRDATRPIYVPGDRARERRQAALQAGIELPDDLYATLQRLRPTPASDTAANPTIPVATGRA